MNQRIGSAQFHYDMYFLILKTCMFHFTSKYNWSLVSIKFNEQMKDIFRHFLWSIDYLRKCTISAVVRYIICDEVRSILSISAKSRVLLLRNNSETTNHVSFYCYYIIELGHVFSDHPSLFMCSFHIDISTVVCSYIKRVSFVTAYLMDQVIL